METTGIEITFLNYSDSRERLATMTRARQDLCGVFL
jgi:hypothetical protein